MLYRLMCLILEHVEKIPIYQDQTSLEPTEKEGSETAKATPHFPFPHKDTGYYTCGPQTRAWRVMLLHQATRVRQLSFLTPALLSLWREGLTIFPSQADSRRLLMTLKVELKSHLFSSFSKATESREFLSTQQVGTWHHTCFCLH